RVTRQVAPILREALGVRPGDRPTGNADAYVVGRQISGSCLFVGQCRPDHSIHKRLLVSAKPKVKRHAVFPSTGRVWRTVADFLRWMSNATSGTVEALLSGCLR